MAGRKKGGRNLSTIESIERARLEMAKAKATGRKLAKDRLEEIMDLCHSISGYYAPVHKRTVEGRDTLVPNANANMEHFRAFVQLWLDAAKALAPFQSPRLNSITVLPPAPEKVEERIIEVKVFEADGSQGNVIQLIPPETHHKRNGK